MTFRLTKAKLFTALLVAICALAAVFAVTVSSRRVSADEIEDDAPVAVSWEYRTGNYQWRSFQSGDAPFTYDNDTDYGNSVRAKLVTGNGEPQYVYAQSEDDAYLSFAGEFDGAAVTALVNATEYTVTINGATGVADENKTIKLKIAPRPIDFGADDLADYLGEEVENRLWLLQDGEGTTPLRDQIAYFDPAAEFNSNYGAEITKGELYNAYVRYTGQAHTVVVNTDYILNETKIGDLDFVDGITYVTANSATGEVNKVNEITTTARLNLKGNWASSDGTQSYVELTKKWYIVTINNAFRMFDGDENVAITGWTYGDEINAMPPRPEHGGGALFTLRKDGETIDSFAVEYTGVGEQSEVAYYVGLGTPAESDYYNKLLASLGTGIYTLTASVNAYTAPADHVHWWDDAEDEAEGVVYCAVSKTFTFSVGSYEFTPNDYNAEDIENSNISINVLTPSVLYSGGTSSVPEALVTFRGVELVADKDYELQALNSNVGRASLDIVGKGNFAGRITIEDAYDIVQGFNAWEELPAVMQWLYGSYDKNVNLITATPRFLDKASGLWFKITTDREGELAVSEELAEFRLTDGIVTDAVANALSGLSVGKYYLFATVDESTNYRRLNQKGVQFQVYQGYNFWKSTPSITGWVEGGYSDEHLPVAESVFGTAVVIIKDSNGVEVYNSKTGVNDLASAGVGNYTLTASVIGTRDYTDLDVYTVNFQVFEKPGMPLWGTLLIIFGSLLVVALIVFILWRKGVFQILTGKLIVAIRTQAAVDATIAAVAANLRNEETKRSVAAAKRREARLARIEQDKALTNDERAAALSEKAKKTAERAEKMLARSEAMQQRAERMMEENRLLAEGSNAEEYPTQEPEVAETNENQTEE